MTTKSSENMLASAYESDDDRAIARNRKKEKQLRYQRHKAHISTPRNDTASPSKMVEETRCSDRLEVEVSESLPIPAVTKAVSTHLREKSSTPTRRKSPEEQPSEKRTSLSKRHQAGARKSNLVHKMRDAKRAAATPTPDGAANDEESKPVVEQLETMTENKTENASGDNLEVEQVSEPRTAIIVESEIVVDELSSCPEVTLDDHPHRLPSDCPPGMTTGQEQTELSAPQRAFDMRSILEHPPTPPHEPEVAPTDEDMQNIEASTDNVATNDVDDDFSHRLVRLDDAQQEEKKEVDDESHPFHQLDTAWDVSNPVFDQSFVPVMGDPAEGGKSGNAPDMFDGSSWEEADAPFPDVEAQFLELMEQPQSLAFTANISFEEKRILDDVKRNLELASSIDDADTSLPEDRKLFVANSPNAAATRLETLKEDEHLPNSDDMSLVGIVTTSEDDEAPSKTLKFQESDAGNGAYSRVELIKKCEPLLLGITSSSDDGAYNGGEYHSSVEDRVEMYNAPNQVDEESSGAEEGEASSEEEGEDTLLDYIGQASDDEDAATVDILNPLSKRTSRKLAREAPTFDAAAVAAMKSCNNGVVEGGGLSSTSAGSVSISSSMYIASEALRDRTTETSLSIGKEKGAPMLAMMPPPPPPPPPGMKKKKKNKRRTGSVNSSSSVPLLGPPPEEKLRKWEDEKMRGHIHLAAVKATVAGTKRDSVNIGDPSLHSRNSESTLFSSDPAKSLKSPSEKAMSPSTIETVIVHQRMADKVIEASSAAAISFEKRFVIERSGVSPDSLQAEETSESAVAIAGGAFKCCGPSNLGTLPLRREGEQWYGAHPSPRETVTFPVNDDIDPDSQVDDKTLLFWLAREVLENTQVQTDQQNFVPLVLRLLLEDDDNFNKACQYLADSVNAVTASLGDDASFTMEDMTVNTTITKDESTVAASKSNLCNPKQRPLLRPMMLSKDSQKLDPILLAANFVSFLYLVSKLSEVPSPFGRSNPFLAEIVDSTLPTADSSVKLHREGKSRSSPQQLIFDHPMGEAPNVIRFLYEVCKKSIDQIKRMDNPNRELYVDAEQYNQRVPSSGPLSPCTSNVTKAKGLRFVVPIGHPSPFETSIWEAPRIIPAILSFLGDPVAVCRIKMVNRYCSRLVSENEHTIMQDAVRGGGLNMNIRPAFWMWIALQKCDQDPSAQGRRVTSSEELKRLERRGHEGNWHHVIERDVERAFGNMPPHKTGARLRTDSIVRALVTWGKNRIMRRGVRGGGEQAPLPELGPSKRPKDKRPLTSVSPPPWESLPGRLHEDEECGGTPTDTVSDWGPISPVASMTESSLVGFPDGEYDTRGGHDVVPNEELALGGNRLTPEMKIDLQNKLSFILHSLAAAHEDVGYCQGLDYVVAHLLRILQDTIRWNAVQCTLPACIVSTSDLPDLSTFKDEPLAKIYAEVDKALVVEEVIFRIMDTFFTHYNLRHMYWPELRCLKTCCRVFERLIQIKLPVLADHFEHHDLNVGLFALGWFQTLFLYLPSMPSATVCHMWDIWLVERSFKIFFRVGTAILFLSQPILLNHELDGIMTYLNTIPDATLLKPDILIPCALNIKVTNRMLQELEVEVTSSGE